MAHVGKRYPLVQPWDLWIFNEHYAPWAFNIPRCWQMVTSGVPVGTLAAKWQDLTVISTPYEIGGDRQSISWKLVHPDDSGAFFTWRVSWEEWNDHEGWPFSNFRYVHEIEYEDAPGVLASGLQQKNANPDQFFNLTGATPFEYTATPYPGLVDPVLFTHTGWPTRFRSSTWEQQEADYHPYRYRP